MTTDDKTLATIRWFIFRARRVAEHSLAVDRDRLLEWAQAPAKIVSVDGRQYSLEISLPDEEAFESLAGRVRPFLMTKDHIYFKNVLSALRSHIEQDAGMRKALDGLEERWSRFDPKSGQTLGYAMQVGKTDGPLGAFVADTTLADAWLYCDFGHGDTNVAERVGQHRLEERYEAAVLLISNVAVCAVSTLELARKAWRKGLLPLVESDFEDRVLARAQLSYELLGFALAPAGTPMERLAESLGVPVDGEGRLDLSVFGDQQ